uniref:Protein kinase domain-containing protein n=1 Tax=Oryzias latipes TaxID=8090 RepID=A0A3P9KVU1_ORYLA
MNNLPHNELFEISCRTLKNNLTSWKKYVMAHLAMVYNISKKNRGFLPCEQVCFLSKDGISIPNCKAILIKSKGTSTTIAINCKTYLTRIKADKNNLIKCIDRFNYGSRAFIVFEMLDQNLHHFLSKRNFSPLGISEIKVISRQLLVALKALKSIGLVHTDIKLDNIMLVDHKSQPFRVKLIDFGLALKLEDLETGSIFQTMPYRAPEVRLGLSLNEGVDMWALGHTLAMLLKGSSLYPCDSDYNGLYSDKFFNMNSEGKWKLDSPIEHLVKTGKKVKLDKRHYSSFEEIFQERNGQVELFVNLLEQMLLIDPYRRITPEEALQHPFFTENNDDNNQIVKAVSGIANKRSAKAQDPISQQDKTFVGEDCSRKYVDRNKDKICVEKCVRVPSCLEILKPKKTYFRSVIDFFSSKIF